MFVVIIFSKNPLSSKDKKKYKFDTERLKDKSVLMFCNMMTTSLKVSYLFNKNIYVYLCFFMLRVVVSSLKKTYVQSFWKFSNNLSSSYVFISSNICHWWFEGELNGIISCELLWCTNVIFRNWLKNAINRK